MEHVGVGVGRRKSLLEQMSALPERRNSLAGLTLDAVLADKRGGGGALTPANPSTRTLFDIIRDDPNTKSFYAQTDRKSWKIFRDKLRLKRAGAAWASSIHIPSSDPPNNTTTRRSFQDMLSSNNSPGDSPSQSRPQFGRRTSTRIASSPTDSNHHDADSVDISMPSDIPPTRSFGPQISRHNSTRVTQRDADDNNAVDPFEVARDGTRRLAAALAEERALSAREAVAAQEAAEEAAAAAAAVEAESPQAVVVEEEEEEEAAAGGEASDEAQPVRMSLMDLLEETDREMGVEGSKYMMGDDEDEEFEEDDDDEEAEAEGGGGIEYNCCVCMVRHKGAAFIPCGHTFCRLCSRELWVQRGNCPLCNNFITEILDIF